MNQKRYWLRGGITVAIIFLIPSFLYFNPLKGDSLGVIFIAPIILVGFVVGSIVGLIYGKIKNKNVGV